VASVLVFGGYTRLRTSVAKLRAAESRFGLFGPSLPGCADWAESPWAKGLLPAADRSGVEWAIMLGRTVAYDPPWVRDAT
jgi:hypothetical protein